MAWLCKECGILNDDTEEVCIQCKGKKDGICCNTIGLELIANRCEEDPWIILTKDTYLGRGEEFCLGKDFLRQNLYVGELHCRIANEGGNWKVYDLGSSNGTGYSDIKLNGMIPSHVGVGIKDGRILRIADLYFRIHITEEGVEKEECIEVEENGSTNESCCEKEGKWVVICPTCGKDYIVESESSRVEECTSLGCDSDRRYDIHRIRPKFVENVE